MRLLSSLAIVVIAVSFALGCGSAGPSGSGGAGGMGTTSTMSMATSTSSGISASTGTTASSATATSGTTTSSSGATSGTGGGTMGASGDCMLPTDCMSGKCVEVTPGGFRVCLAPPQMATTCDDPGIDQCCATMPCPGGAPCYMGPLVPFCSGTPIQPHNQCGVDQCNQDADCDASQICVLAGTFGDQIRACVHAGCKLDGDCAAHPGGVCAPVREPCCGASAGLFCTYPASDGCRSNADCPTSPSHPSRYCAPDVNTGVASCQDGAPVCPA